ncbi:MAG TPA: Rv3654c family TadE-like protein [Dermatophilaceae bacterium]|nr:Rv3654c family TadE-like protein [Dermatophilaceae bacterium]
MSSGRRPPRARGGPGTERGSGTVLATAAVGVVLVLAVAALHLLSAVLAAHRARSAADLAALAGAQVAYAEGRPSQACLVAGGIAERNSARVVDCEVAAVGEVAVRVAAAVSLPLPGLARTATARARAGPAP